MGRMLFCKKLNYHQCFIEPSDEEKEDPKLKKIAASEVSTRAMVHTDEAQGV